MKKLALSTGRGKEIAGLLKKKKMMMMMKNMMTPKIVKSHMSRFSRAKVEAGTGGAIGRDQSRSSSW